MSYTPTTWQTGDTITAEKLNHMEGGISCAMPIASDTLIVTFTWNEEDFQYETETAFNDMVTAVVQSKPILAIVPSLGSVPLSPLYDDLGENIIGFTYGDTLVSQADDPNELKLMNRGIYVYYDSETQTTGASISSGTYYVEKAT